MPDLVYGRETKALADAATAQDIVDLFPVAPIAVVLALRAARGCEFRGGS
jgi:hypothetical protein